MAKILVVYCSKYGQTRKIAEAIRAELKRLGDSVDVIEVASAPDSKELKARRYDAVIAGAPVYQSSYPKKFVSWASRNSQVLSALPTSFYSVCLGILETTNERAQREERLIVETFLAKSGWTPQVWTIFAGALTYSQYHWLIRLIMKRIAKKAGGDTDTSRDYQYTDWNEVRRYAREFSKSLGGRNFKFVR